MSDGTTIGVSRDLKDRLDEHKPDGVTWDYWLEQQVLDGESDD